MEDSFVVSLMWYALPCTPSQAIEIWLGKTIGATQAEGFRHWPQHELNPHFVIQLAATAKINWQQMRMRENRRLIGDWFYTEFELQLLRAVATDPQMPTTKTNKSTLIACVALLSTITMPCNGQSVSSRLINSNLRSSSVEIPSGMRMEFISLEPIVSHDSVQVSNVTTVRSSSRIISEMVSATRNVGPPWEIIYSSAPGMQRLVLSSDTILTNVSGSTSSGSITNRTTTLRKILPDVIVGPASFRMFHTDTNMFMLNFRLLTNS
jgi:hypothetical protein